MKIRVADLKPNPFRDIENYPISRKKVDALKQSIEMTSFWDNLLCRPDPNGGYQLAYGHHRNEAIRELSIEEIDIPVRELDDHMMMQIMWQENLQEYDAKPSVIIETVRKARDYIRDNSEVCGGHTPQAMSDSNWPGFRTVSEFLGGPLWRIRQAMEDIAAIDRDDVVEEALNILPSQEHTSRYREAIGIGTKKYGEKLSRKSQVGAAQQIVDSGVGKRNVKEIVEDAFIREHGDLPTPPPEVKKVITQERIDKLTELLRKAATELRAIRSIHYVTPAQVAGLSAEIRRMQSAIEEVMRDDA